MNGLRQLYATLCRLRHRYGFGVHSPFAFDLLTGVVYERHDYYAYAELKRLRRKAPPALPCCSAWTDCLLFRLVNRFQPETVVEVGTGAGLSICYMAAAKKETHCVTMDTERHEAVASILKKYPAVTYRKAVLQGGTALHDFQSIDLLHVAHTSCYEALFEEAVAHASPRSLFVIEGICDSPAKQKWWKRVVADSRTGVTFDLHGMGLVFFDPSLPKQHYLS